LINEIEAGSLADKFGMEMGDIFCRQTEEGWVVTDSTDQLDIGLQLEDKSYALDVIRIQINTRNNDAEQDSLKAAASDDA
jgi:hypothetical protein